MKSFRLLIVSIFGSLLLMPALAGGTVSAQQAQQTLECSTFVEFPEGNCDMAILKEVSVNGGPFLDANTAAEAANATVGDTVVWRVTVTNESTGDFDNPLFTVFVQDILPAGFNLTGNVASDGVYDSSTNIWTLPLITEFPEGFFSNLPSTLTLTTTATSPGLFENIASFFEYDGCGDDCIGPYADDVTENNSNNAFVNISAPPVVLAATTDPPPQVLAATGNGVAESLVAAGLITATLGILGYNHFTRKPVYYSAYARQRRN